MRIISGNFKGRNIIAPSSLPVRPTTDFAKTALFNIITNHFDFESISVLDLFAGIGSISFEFASRGTEKIIAVDNHVACLKFIKDMSLKLNINSIRTIKADAFRFIQSHSSTDEKYDIIFADPPFELESTDQLPDLIFEKEMLKENGWAIIEYRSQRKLQSKRAADEVRVYGNCAFSIYKSS